MNLLVKTLPLEALHTVVTVSQSVCLFAVTQLWPALPQGATARGLQQIREMLQAESQIREPAASVALPRINK